MVRVFVEGEDDKRFIISVFLFLKQNKLVIFESNANFDNYITIMGNKSKLLNIDSYRDKSPIITKKGTKVLFVFDCDLETDDKKCGGMEKSEECLEKLKKELNWNIPIDHYIFNQNLDYFIAETIDKEHCLPQIEKCLDLNTLKPNRKPLAALYGIIYPKAPYNLDHPNFDDLKQKLINLFN
ncbi:MAG: hypothetical protein WA945_08800 [Arcobacteraceae bacterium]